MNKEKTCCFSGHRKLSRAKLPITLKRLKSEIEKLIGQGVDRFIVGGALGFDTMAASMIISLKELGHPNIKLVFALPCHDQDRFWKQREKDFYKELLQEADEIVYVSEKYHQGCMHERNRWMIDHSAYCICYLTENSGGTFYTVGYAKEKHLTIINLS